MHLTFSYYPLGTPTRPEWHHWTIEFPPNSKAKVTHGVCLDEDDWESFPSTIEKFHAFTLANPAVSPTIYFNERTIHADRNKHRTP